MASVERDALYERVSRGRERSKGAQRQPQIGKGCRVRR